VFLYCENCGANPKTKLVIRKEALPVRGDGVTYLYSLLMVCKDCGADIWNEKLEEITLRRAFRKYYRKNKDKEDVVAWYKNLKYRQKQRRQNKPMWIKLLDKLFKI
jgi:uncharacterized Zn finger protein